MIQLIISTLAVGAVFYLVYRIVDKYDRKKFNESKNKLYDGDNTEV